MVKVNLLPPKERTKKQIIRESFTAIVLSVIAVSLIIGFSVFLFIIGGNFDKDVKEVETQIANQKQKNDKYKDVENKVSKFNKSIENINELKKQGLKWFNVLEEIKNKIPANITVNELSATPILTKKSSQETDSKDSGSQNTKKSVSPPQQILLTMRGEAGDLVSIMKFKEALSTSTLFDYIDFESSAWQKEKNKYDFSFQTKLK
ncbi:hypothetical protein COX95_01290 [bacterium CG_4_10_14_0_2_um_filter_33_32]|nr:MAG: hypothetical protein AUJ93_00815 [bacterium CG2_30_33_46]PIZ86438.1 MAG: hypothetical protein COX95_01290 [bacterium CG_4_10_14_0_2_um_filter_33_32]